MWHGQLTVDGITQDMKGDCKYSEDIREKYISKYVRERNHKPDTKDWPNSELHYTFPDGNCGKTSCEDGEGNCWTYLGEDRQGQSQLGRQAQIATSGPHNKQGDQFVRLPKSKKYRETRRHDELSIGERHPER